MQNDPGTEGADGSDWTPVEQKADRPQTDAGQTGAQGSEDLCRGFRKIFGTWIEDPAFDEAMKYFDQIDDEMWTASPEGDLDADA